jgi:ectoine hydroxylase-related dioxygenase (phytanoyl-CoA dioxygenase family)
VAGWAALEDSDESNGSLVIYPGSHKSKKIFIVINNNKKD